MYAVLAEESLARPGSIQTLPAHQLHAQKRDVCMTTVLLLNIIIQLARSLKFAPLLLAPRPCPLQLLLPLIVWDIMYQSNHSVVHATNHWPHPLLLSVEVIGNQYMWWRHLFSLTKVSEIKPGSSDSESYSFPNHCQIHLLSNSTIEGLRTRVG